jgi:hypothetical protein
MPVIPLGSDTSNWVQNPDGTWGPPQHVWGPPHLGGSPSGPIIPGPNYGPPHLGGSPSGPIIPGTTLGMPARPASGMPPPDDPLGSSVTLGAAPPPMPARPVSGLPAGPLAAPGGGIGSDANFPTGAPPGMGGIGSDANFPVAPAAAPTNPLANAPLPPPRPKGRIDPRKVNLGYGAPFTTVARPNADPTNPRGGAPLATALDLSALFRGRQT